MQSTFTTSTTLQDPLILGGEEFHSRLILGSGKYRDDAQIPHIIQAGSIQMITVALRRVSLNQPQKGILSHVPSGTLVLPNTSGARNAEEAIRVARLARASGCGDWIKIEIIRDQKYLLPDGQETVEATRVLASEGFKVLPYVNPDIYVTRSLKEAGAVAVMPLGAPIGSNLGLQTKAMISLLLQEDVLPVVVDAGLGSPSQAAEAMEMGVQAVMVNTAIASSEDPVMMARAFAMAVQAGRQAYLAGLGPINLDGEASSPLTGFLHD